MLHRNPNVDDNSERNLAKVKQSIKRENNFVRNREKIGELFAVLKGLKMVILNEGVSNEIMELDSLQDNGDLGPKLNALCSTNREI